MDLVTLDQNQTVHYLLNYNRKTERLKKIYLTQMFFKLSFSVEADVSIVAKFNGNIYSKNKQTNKK